MTSAWHPGGTNPVLPGFHPDPSVCRVGEWTYLVTSTFEYLPGLPVHRSKDLVTWEPVGHVIDREGMLDLSGVADSRGLYAPTIRHDGERFYVVCTVVGGDSREGHFVCVADDPAGPWSDPVWWDGVAGIDPSLLFDGDDAWCMGTRLAAEPTHHDQTEVWVRRFDTATLTPVGGETVIWTGALKGAIWAEGPHLYRRDDGYLLLAAEGGTAHHHAVCVARADDVTGPYVGNPGNPVLTHRHLGSDFPVTNVGHADLVELADGSTWALLLASRPVDGADLLGRETFLAPVTWEEGWPVLAPSVGMLELDPPTPAGHPVRRPHSFHDTFTRGLDVRWIAARQLPQQIASPGDDGLTFTAPGALLHRVTTLDATIEALVSDGAGLLLRHSDDDCLRVDIVGGTATVRVLEGGAVHEEARGGAADRALITLTLAGTEATVDVDGTVLARVPLTHMCAARTAGFVGLTAGPSATRAGARVLDYRFTSRTAAPSSGGDE